METSLWPSDVSYANVLVFKLYGLSSAWIQPKGFLEKTAYHDYQVLLWYADENGLEI